jgi:hypothetical protein
MPTFAPSGPGSTSILSSCSRSIISQESGLPTSAVETP